MPGFADITGGIGPVVLKSGLYVIAFLGVALILWFFTFMRKRRKLQYPLIELVRYGTSGEIYGLNYMPKGAGWFGKEKTMFGLWDRGEKVMKTKYGDEIVGFSTDDYREVNNQRGIVVYRDPDDQDILVPISKIEMKNQDILAHIAPVELREKGAELMKQASKETSDRTEKLAVTIVLGLVCIVVLIVSIILVNAISKNTADINNQKYNETTSCISQFSQVCSSLIQQAKSPNGILVTPSTASNAP